MILTQLQWHLYVYPYCFRLWLAKYFSMMVVVKLSVYYAVLTRRRYDPNSTAVAFVRLFLLFQIMASEVFLYDGGGDVISLLRCTY